MRIEWEITKSNLYGTFSLVERIESNRKVVTNNEGMKKGCKTSHTVRASPVRDIKRR